MWLSPRVVIALAPLLLGGCNYLNTPPADFMNRCLRFQTMGSIGGPLSTLLQGFASRGAEVSWSRGPNGMFILRAIKNNPVNNDKHVIALGLNPVDGTLPSEHGCGPNAVVPANITIDNEEENAYVGEDLLVGIMEDIIRERQTAATRPSPPPPPQPSSIENKTTPVASNEQDELADEADADRVYYATLERQGLSKKIVIEHDGQTYCCVTLQNIVDRLRQQGAEVVFDGDSGGSARLEVNAPRGAWRGHKQLTFEFGVAGDAGLQPVAVKDGDTIIASPGGKPGSSTYELLAEQFDLRPEPVR